MNEVVCQIYEGVRGCTRLGGGANHNALPLTKNRQLKAFGHTSISSDTLNQTRYYPGCEVCERIVLDLRSQRPQTWQLTKLCNYTGLPLQPLMTSNTMTSATGVKRKTSNVMSYCESYRDV